MVITVQIQDLSLPTSIEQHLVIIKVPSQITAVKHVLLASLRHLVYQHYQFETVGAVLGLRFHMGFTRCHIATCPDFIPSVCTMALRGRLNLLIVVSPRCV